MDWSLLQNQDSVTGNFQLQSPPEFTSKNHASLDDLFASHTTDMGDMGLEWLSTFVEDCLSSTGSCLPFSEIHQPKIVQTNSSAPPQKQSDNHKLKKTTLFFLQRIEIPGKARSKRKRRPVLNIGAAGWFRQDQSFTDPPLLQQAYWLADSELIVNPTGKDENIIKKSKNQRQLSEEVAVDTSSNGGLQQQRRCSHCLAQRTPQWRAGPLGPKTLCNACGVRYKSGRLLPEYRPAKSPTFVSYKHSNSHKKVMEMRTAFLQSNS